MTRLRQGYGGASAPAVIFLALAVLHTWPLASAPHRLSMNYNADAQLVEWIISWVARTLPTRPSILWQGNIFQPGENSLTFAEPLIVPAIAGAPIFWLGGSPVLMANLLTIAGLALTGFAGWWVVTRWTGSARAGLVAGTLLAFNPHLLTRLPHLQAVNAWGLILACYFADRVLRRQGSWWPLIIIWPLVAGTSLYLLFFTAGAVVLLAIVEMMELKSAAGAVRPATLVIAGGVLALPILWPHMTHGVTRPLFQVADFSATPGGYLTSMSHVHQGWSKRFFTTDIDVFFPGVIAIGLALTGLYASTRRETPVPIRWRTVWLVLLAIAGFVLSLGIATPIYGWLYHLLPPLQGIRAAARFGIWYLTAIAVLSGFAIAWLERRLRPTLVPWVVSLVVAGVTIENLMAPVRTMAYNGPPAIYSFLKDDPKPVLLVEFPFYPPDAMALNGEYVENATAHWRPIANGFSGVTPTSYRELSKTLWFFPDQEAVDTLVKMGATHAMVHLEKFLDQAPSVIRTLDRQPGLRLVAADRDGHRLYRVVRE